ncbi:hypothetical protein N7492_007358 [Penicillium capsulatum]|uniref:Uncharacterized protein n=1 Tax=Penicillium capsulatum TaxID=69766 RepID=A0A9W9I1V2_9EURO|nr:hypothetical protein N7492_007358 [Penicillium capsulatum]KAJ6117198.1 hypothetical protein N7512_006923 [Penicillium capsulatum]
MFSWLLVPIFEQVDAWLVKHGSFEELQTFRLSVVRYYTAQKPQPENPEKACRAVMEREICLCMWTQREDTLSERHQLLKDTASSQEDQNQLQQLQSEIEANRKECYFLQRELLLNKWLYRQIPYEEPITYRDPILGGIYIRFSSRTAREMAAAVVETVDAVLSDWIMTALMPQDIAPSSVDAALKAGVSTLRAAKIETELVTFSMSLSRKTWIETTIGDLCEPTFSAFVRGHNAFGALELMYWTRQ